MKLYKRMHLESWNRDILFDRYITFKNYINKGHSEFYWIKGLLTMVLIPSAWLKIYFPKISIWFTIGFAVIGFFTWLFIGVFWDRLKLFQREAEWSNRRNPSIQEIKNNTKRKV